MEKKSIINEKRGLINKKIKELRQSALNNLMYRDANMRRFEDLIERSPVKIKQPYPIMLLETLYEPQEYIYIGKNNCENIKTHKVSDWIKLFNDEYYLKNFDAILPKVPEYPFINPNPLLWRRDAIESAKGMQGLDFLARVNRFVVLELNDIAICQQLSFWTFMLDEKFPVAAVIYDGGNTTQCWLEVNSESLRRLDEFVGLIFFDEHMIPSPGIDASYHYPTKLAMFPGHFRENEQKWQGVLYMKKKKSEYDTLCELQGKLEQEY